VTRLSSLFDVPAQLAMLLSLAVSTAATEPPRNVREVAALVVATTPLVEPLKGSFNFGERAWLRALHENAEVAETIGARVFVTSGGRYYLPAPADRPRVLAARADDDFAARVAYRAAVRNAAAMRTALHRPPTAGDLYIAHIFGASAAVEFIQAVDEAPDAALDQRFPTLIGSAAAIMNESKDTVTVAQFYKRLSGVLREPPRLIAIGLDLKPRGAQRKDAGSAAVDTTEMAWQAKVDVAVPDKRTQ
jgi:hypothetical protein